MPIFGKKPEKMSDDELLQKASDAFRMKQWDKASEHMRVLVGKNPQHTQARVILTMALIQEQKADEAMEHSRFLVNQDPQNPLFHQYLGASYQLKGMNDEAIQSFRNALDINEDPQIRGIVCFLKTPDIPFINIESIDQSMSNILARAISGITTSPISKEIMDEEGISKISELGNKMQDDIIAGKEHGKFLKEVADACLEKNCYSELKDLLRKFDSIEQLKEHLQQLEAETGIKGRFAQFQHLNFVQFEKE